MKAKIVLMELGNINYKNYRIYAMEDTMIYDGMIFKANHNLFEVKIIL